MSKILTMSHQDYLAHPAYGASDLVKMSRSMAYWKFKKANPDPPGRPLIIGSAFHLMLQSEFDPECAKGKIEIYEGEGSSKTKAFTQFQMKNPNAYCLDEDEFTLCLRMKQAILDEPEVMGYLEGAIAEPTIMGLYPETNVHCKVRPDYLHVGKGVSINIKTTQDASEPGFIYAARDYGYDFQSALYCDILTQELERSFEEIHILVEKGDSREECEVSIFTFGDDTLAHARTMIRNLMEKIPVCEKDNKWPRKPVYLQSIDLPLYCRRVVMP